VHTAWRRLPLPLLLLLPPSCSMAHVHGADAARPLLQLLDRQSASLQPARVPLVQAGAAGPGQPAAPPPTSAHSTAWPHSAPHPRSHQPGAPALQPALARQPQQHQAVQAEQSLAHQAPTVMRQQALPQPLPASRTEQQLQPAQSSSSEPDLDVPEEQLAVRAGAAAPALPPRHAPAPAAPPSSDSKLRSQQEAAVFQQYAMRWQQQQAQSVPLLLGQELQQGTEAWLQLREGRLTASATAEAAGFFSIGSFADRIMGSGWPALCWRMLLPCRRWCAGDECACCRGCHALAGAHGAALPALQSACRPQMRCRWPSGMPRCARRSCWASTGCGRRSWGSGRLPSPTST
jgi:hypothetical protein